MEAVQEPTELPWPGCPEPHRRDGASNTLHRNCPQGSQLTEANPDVSSTVPSGCIGPV